MASGHGDGLSGRCLYVGYDVAGLVQRAAEIQRTVTHPETRRRGADLVCFL